MIKSQLHYLNNHHGVLFYKDCLTYQWSIFNSQQSHNVASILIIMLPHQCWVLLYLLQFLWQGAFVIKTDTFSTFFVNAVIMRMNSEIPFLFTCPEKTIWYISLVRKWIKEQELTCQLLLWDNMDYMENGYFHLWMYTHVIPIYYIRCPVRAIAA